jgi:hypothetical protein
LLSGTASTVETVGAVGLLLLVYTRIRAVWPLLRVDF